MCTNVHKWALGPRDRAGKAILIKLQTYSLLGLDALGVEAEVDVSPKALPKTVLVGLPEATVRESTQHVPLAMVDIAGGITPLRRAAS